MSSKGTEGAVHALRLGQIPPSPRGFVVDSGISNRLQITNLLHIG